MARPWTLALTRSLPAVAFRLLLLFSVFVGACAPDESLTGSGTRVPLGNAAANVIGDPDLALAIEADLTCLYDKAGLLPNAQSSLGKFNTIKSNIANGDIAGAISATENLIAFIELKYSQYNNKNAVIQCDPPIGSIGITELKDRTITRLTAFVTLTGKICEVPAGSGGKYCKTADNQTAMVYFPPAIFEQLTYVSLEENPSGFTQLQNLGLDEYPNYVRIKTLPVSNFAQEPLKPLVVVCFNNAVTPLDPALRARLLLGHRHTDENNVVTFKLLPEPDFNAYGASVQSEVDLFCANNSASMQVAPFSERTLLGRVGNRVANFLTPAPLQARTAFGFGGGVGGSAEEFSEFGAVDRGLTGKGGIGGSAEEFIRTGRPTASMTSTATPYIGKAGVDNAVTDPARLPKVQVVAPGAAQTPIAGVEVTFEVIDPKTYSDTSEASLCGTTTTAITDANGEARPPCINFGNDLGFRNLKVTFDPTLVAPLACMLNADGVCATETTSVNFLLQTVAGEPAKLGVVGTPGATSAQAGAAMVDQPVLQVQDAGGNPVTNLAAAYPVTVTVSAGGSVAGSSSATDLATGRITLSGLALGGTVGTSYQLTFATPGLTSATASVTVSSAGAPAVFTVTPTTATAQAGGLIPTLTASVRDAFGNGIAGATVTVSSANLACFSGSGCTSGTTGANGSITFADLSIQGAGTSRTLTFATAGLPDQTVALTLTPGAASAITTANPTDGNFGSGLAVGATLTPQVRVTDAWGNGVGGASIVWQLQSTASGATVSPGTTTAATGGLSSTSWKLGDGDNGLKAFLGSTSGPFAQFLAASATGGVSLSCAASGSLRKLDMGGYNSTAGTYTGYFSMKPELTARFRSLRLFMSATGQSSFSGAYPATVEIYRGSVAPGNLLGTGSPVGGGISIPGDNGSAVPIDFSIDPNTAAAVAAAGNTNLVIFKLVVTAPSNRTLQLWYNAKPPAGTCSTSLLYQAGVTNFAAASARDYVKGLLIRVSN
ncbi:MAG: hypothetical protein SFU84_01535 [Gemmatimonadales bacterium]|nr:hypothetical protein [Gemmatimonadales bacterium]